MCGIVAYIGGESALPRLIEGLRRLEYRGYDSAGVAVLDGDGLWVRKDIGRVSDLAGHLQGGPGTQVGIAHTRWATHGGVTQLNAHPHTDGTGRIAVVHNGIIENGSEIRARLSKRGVVFKSETDTEVLPHLIREAWQGDPLQAVRNALAHVRGTYGIAVVFADAPDVLVVARNGSPLVVGLGRGETVVASDPQAVVAHTRQVVYLQDKEIALVTREGAQVSTLEGREVQLPVETLDGDYGLASKEGFPHFMLKEIHEQPRSIRDSM
ncbi:MAG: glutamine--fructose-6-phosphate aminotransferase, partial [Myxococcales bacterium]|nr:glutamine--fructose-6-phosphate aminotransferase [Myxococcales bacterium]